MSDGDSRIPPQLEAPRMCHMIRKPKTGFNNRRLLKPIEDIPSREFEQHHYDQREAQPMMAGLN